MPTIYIDNQPYPVPEGDRSLLEVCLSLGFDLPYFCWHPALHSVGACRQCAVKLFKDAADTRGRIVMSCMTPVKDGMRLSIADPEAAAFRAGIAELLMVNHPHDCPVCDEGGECHLQDMTVMTGAVHRRYRFTKRTHRDQDLGPFVNMEMNRCIQCYRCVRFYRDYAGGRDFGVMGWHDHVFFGRHASGALASEFSGNLVEVCPTGAFTDKTLKKHYTRKWDLAVSPSVCVHCGLGCNVIPGERYGSLRRVRARFSAQVNGYFLCDRGRYGYEFANSDRRIRTALVRGEDGVLRPASRKEAIDACAKTQARQAKGRVIGIGSPRASVESNFALRELVGAERFFQGVSRRELELTNAVLNILHDGPCAAASLKEVESARAVFVLGEDVTNTAPMLDLAIRQAVLQKPRETARKLGIPAWDDGPTRLVVQEDRGPLFIATPGRTKLDDQAAATLRAAPDDLARLGFAVAHEIDPAAPDVAGLPEAARTLATRIARELQAATNPLVIAGESCGSLALLHAAANVAWALSRKGRLAKLCFTTPECNSLGLGLMGGGPIEAALDALRGGSADTLIILENDLYRHVPAETADALFAAAKNVIVIDHVTSPTVEKAQVVLPAAAFGEADGTFVNNEGRAQRFYKAFVPAEPIQDAWRWLGCRGMGVPPMRSTGILPVCTTAVPAVDASSVASFSASSASSSSSSSSSAAAAAVTAPERAKEEEATGETPVVHMAETAMLQETPSIDALHAEIAKALPVFAPLTQIAPPAGFRMVGQRIPRQPYRYSGRTAMNADLSVHEPKPPQDPDAPLAFSMEGFQGRPPGALLANYWSPGWNSVQAINKFQIEVGGSIRPAASGELHGGDPGRRLIEPRAASEAIEEEEEREEGERGQDPYGAVWLARGTQGQDALATPYFTQVPPAFAPRKGQWLTLPAHHIFGSEELSVHSPGVRQLAPPPYVAVSPDEAARAGLTDGREIELSVAGRVWRLTVQVRPGLPAGVAAIPAGLPQLAGMELPAWATIPSPV